MIRKAVSKLKQIEDRVGIEEAFQQIELSEVWDYISRTRDEFIDSATFFEKQSSRIVLWGTNEEGKAKRLMTLVPLRKKGTVAYYSFPNIAENKSNRKILTKNNYRTEVLGAFKTMITV